MREFFEIEKKDVADNVSSVEKMKKVLMKNMRETEAFVAIYTLDRMSKSRHADLLFGFTDYLHNEVIPPTKEVDLDNCLDRKRLFIT